MCWSVIVVQKCRSFEEAICITALCTEEQLHGPCLYVGSKRTGRHSPCSLAPVTFGPCPHVSPRLRLSVLDNKTVRLCLFFSFRSPRPHPAVATAVPTSIRQGDRIYRHSHPLAPPPPPAGHPRPPRAAMSAKASGADSRPNGDAKNRSHHDGSSGRAFTVEQKTAVVRIKRCSPTAFYEILGLEEVKTTCSDAEIKKAYRKLSLLTHPDKNGYEGADEAFKRMAALYCDRVAARC